MENFIFSFLSLFVAIDPPGLVVLVLEYVTEEGRTRIITTSVITATAVGALFLFFGRLILTAIGVSEADFQVAGGIILFMLAIQDLFAQERRRKLIKDMAIVPLGTPLIVGPATLTTLMLLRDLYGLTVPFLAFIANMLLLFAALIFASRIVNVINVKILKALGKIIAIILASIGVRMVRTGIIQILSESKSL